MKTIVAAITAAVVALLATALAAPFIESQTQLNCYRALEKSIQAKRYPDNIPAAQKKYLETQLLSKCQALIKIGSVEKRPATDVT